MLITSPGLGAGGGPDTPDGALSQAEVDQLEAGIDQIFAPIDAALGVQVFAEQLPLVGDNLKEAFDAGSGPLHHVQTLRTAIASGLNTLSGSGSYTTAQVDDAITAALGSAEISGAGVTATGGAVRVDFTTSKTHTTTSPLEASFGLPGVGFESSGTANTELGYTFNFGVGLDTSGFFFDTSPANELSLSLNTFRPWGGVKIAQCFSTGTRCRGMERVPEGRKNRPPFCRPGRDLSSPSTRTQH